MGARSDNFTRADSAVTLNPPSDGGANYAFGATSGGIQSNKAYAPGGGNVAAGLETTTLADADVSLVIGHAELGIFQGLTLRSSGSPNFYGWDFIGDPSGWRLVENGVSGGTLRQSDTAVGITTGCTLRAVCNGPTITIYINGTQVGITQTGATWQQTGTIYGYRYGDLVTLTSFTVAGLTPVNPTIYVLKGDQTSVTFQCSDGSPSTNTPITRVGLFVGTSSAFIPSGSPTVTGSGSTLTVTGLSDDVERFAILRVHDSTGATFDSFPTPFSRWKHPAVIGFIGDSITRGYIAPSGTANPTAPQACASALAYLGGNRYTGSVNRGADASEVLDWIPGSTGGNYLPGAITAFNANSDPLDAIFITLLTNDSTGLRTVNSVTTGLTAIANALISGVTNWRGTPLVVILPSSGLIPQTTGTTNIDQLFLYFAALPALDNGTTIRVPTDIYRPYKAIAEQSNTLLSTGGVHPTNTGDPTGYRVLGQIWAELYAQVVGDLAGGYTAASNVRSGTDRGDGTLGTLAVPTAAQVLSGVAVDATVGTYVTVATGSVKTGVAFGAGSALTGTYDGSDRWSDPGVTHVQNGTVYKANSTSNNRTGTYDPITGQYTDPGVAHVQSGSTYKFAGSTLTGTYDPITGQYTDPGVAHVQSGITYTFAGSVLTGTFAGGSGGTYTDPGTANVKIGVTYTFNNVLETGTYDGSDRWSDPGIAHVEQATVYKANSPTNNRTGTLENPTDAAIAAAVWTYANRTLNG